jgi:hypothetical protein
MVSRNDVVTIDRLLDVGADPDRPIAPDQTPPLYWAAWRGRSNAVREGTVPFRPFCTSIFGCLKRPATPQFVKCLFRVHAAG